MLSVGSRWPGGLASLPVTPPCGAGTCDRDLWSEAGARTVVGWEAARPLVGGLGGAQAPPSRSLCRFLSQSIRKDSSKSWGMLRPPGWGCSQPESVGQGGVRSPQTCPPSAQSGLHIAVVTGDGDEGAGNGAQPGVRCCPCPVPEGRCQCVRDYGLVADTSLKTGQRSPKGDGSGHGEWTEHGL